MRLLPLALLLSLLAAPRARACGSGSPTSTGDLLRGPVLLLTAVDLAFTAYSLPMVPRVRALSVAQVAVAAPQALLYFTLAARNERSYDIGSQGVLLGLGVFNTLLAAGAVWSLGREGERRFMLAPAPGGATLAGSF